AAEVAKALAAEGEGALKADLVTGLLEALVGEMGRSIRWKPRWQLKAFVALRKVLSSLPKVMEHAVAILKKSEDPPALLVAAVAAEGTAKAESAYRAPLVELYVKIVLEGKQALPEYSLEAWGPVLA
ncbi:unnamed protein product, partial [Polarella glacialis]